jgi:membrane protein
VRWRWISWGSGAVILFWVLASLAFSTYVSNFAHYDRTYGSLGAVIGFMVWIYLSTVVVLAGAELNSEIEHQTAVDTTTGAPRPMGLRGATMADSVGQSARSRG